MPASTSAASAICGTARGLTKDVTSSLRTPAATMASMVAILSRVGMKSCSIWNPSRVPTSQIRTDLG